MDINPIDNSCDFCNAVVDSITFTLSDDGTSYVISDASDSISGAITIPSTYNNKPVTTIGSRAFESCTSLINIVIPDSVTTIGKYAFAYCDSLTSIIIPDSVTIIGEDAFYSCDSLTDVYFTGTKEEWNNLLIGSYDEFLTNVTIHYNYVEE